MTSPAMFDETWPFGAVVGPLFGREVPLHYGDWMAEYVALKRGDGLVWLGDSTQIEITGDDRVPFLNRLCTNQLAGLSTGEGRETFLTNAKGHVVAHGLVFVGPESLVLRTDSGQAQTILTHLDYYLIHDDVQLHDRSAAWSELLVCGAEAEKALVDCLGNQLPVEPLASLEMQWKGLSLAIRRPGGWTLPAFLLSSDTAVTAGLCSALHEAGAKACGHLAWEAIRVEQGWPAFGRDITAANLPQEIGRDSLAISFRKGCYLGQETVARLDSRGHVNKLLVGLRFESAAVPPAGCELLVQGRPAGGVTSASFSPDCGVAIALGYVRREHSQPRTRLETPAGPATIVALPL